MEFAISKTRSIIFFFEVEGGHTFFSSINREGKKAKVDFEEFLQIKNTYFKMDTVFCYYNTHSFIWDTL